MKKVIKPAIHIHQHEKATYFCDITGVEMKDWVSATLVVDCGYASDRDGLKYTLHLSQEGLDKVMKALKSTLPAGRKMQEFAVDHMDSFGTELPSYDEDKT